MGFHIPKGYLYFAMLFSVLVEGLNVTVARRRRVRAQHTETAPDKSSRSAKEIHASS
jgi:predicted tellurium resistance membrane protein TerC